MPVFFTGFATHGSKELNEIGWNEIHKDDLPYKYEGMEIDNEWKMRKLPELRRMKIWDALYHEGGLY